MIVGKALLKNPNQVDSIVCRDICAKFGLERLRSNWDTPWNVVKNEWAMILFYFHIQTDKQMMIKQLDIVVVMKKVHKKVVMIEVAVPNDRNIRLRNGEKLEKYQELREQMERTWGGNTTVIPEVIGTLGAATP